MPRLSAISSRSLTGLGLSNKTSQAIEVVKNTVRTLTGSYSTNADQLRSTYVRSIYSTSAGTTSAPTFDDASYSRSAVQEYTAEVWFYPTSITSATGFVPLSWTVSASIGTSTTGFFQYGTTDSSRLHLFMYNSGNGLDLSAANWGITTATPVVNNSWNHAAMAIAYNASSGPQVAFWLNGVRQGYTLSLNNYGFSGTYTTGSRITIGGNPLFSKPFSGYISDVRISNIDRYGYGNATITPGTGALSNDANTLALISAV